MAEVEVWMEVGERGLGKVKCGRGRAVQREKEEREKRKRNKRREHKSVKSGM